MIKLVLVDPEDRKKLCRVDPHYYDSYLICDADPCLTAQMWLRDGFPEQLEALYGYNLVRALHDREAQYTTKQLEVGIEKLARCRTRHVGDLGRPTPMNLLLVLTTLRKWASLYPEGTFQVR